MKFSKVKVDKQKLKEANEVFESIGITSERAFDLFLDKVAFDGKLPFSIDGVSIKAKQDRDFMKGIIDILFAECEYIYYVNMDTHQYREYVTSNGFKAAGPDNIGDDWFRDSYNNIDIIVYEKDKDMVRKALSKDNLMKVLKDGHSLSLNYRLITTGVPVYYNLRASYSSEDSSYILVEVRNVNKRFEKEDEYNRKLKKANEEARIDTLTKVNNYLAFDEYRKVINERIKSNDIEFAFVMCDLNDLKNINDDLGHFMGDQYLIESVDLIKRFYPNSKLFRVGGDEFIIIVEHEDYQNRVQILEEFRRIARENVKQDKPVIAIGMAEVTNDVKNVDDLYRIADKEMYLDKNTYKKQQK